MRNYQFIKRSLATIFTVCFMTLFIASVSAAGDPMVSPRYVGISTISCDLSISENGYASCEGHSHAYPGYTADVTLELQQDIGYWDTIKSWTGSGRSVPFEKGYFVAEGYDYRVKITSVVYDSNGNYIETISATTGTHSY